MHIAICDDDIAHRKHFERLMTRESDTRSVVETPLYIDAFGSEEALFHALMQYDLFFLSISKDTTDVFDLVKKLRTAKVNVPIVICTCKDIDYHAVPVSKDTFFIDNPLKPTQLHEMIMKAHDYARSAKPLYEIRSAHTTLYLEEEEILYALILEERKYQLFLANGSDIICDHSIRDFYAMVKYNDAFIFTGKTAVVNLRYVSGFKTFYLTMKNGDRLPIALSEKSTMIYKQKYFFDSIKPTDSSN